MLDEQVSHLCDLFFDTNPAHQDIDYLLGYGRECEWSSSSDNSQMVIDVYPDPNSAHISANMNLIINNIWPINPPSMTNAAYAPQVITVLPDWYAFLPIQGDIKFNPHNILGRKAANCNTGLTFDWSSVSGLCGATNLEVEILAVFNYNSSTIYQFSDSLTVSNN